jgi:ribonuclease H2 subunit A
VPHCLACRADSKQLKESFRDSLFEKIKSDGRIGYAIEVISPEAISAAMLQRIPTSLNAISHESAMALIRAVMDRGVQVARVYVDTVGDPGSYQAKLTRSFDRSIEFTVAKKADSLYKTVSAASICAKVTRDAALREWVFREPVLRSGLAAEQQAAGAAAISAAEAVSGEEAAGDEGQEEDGDDYEHGDEEDAGAEEDVVPAGRAAKRARIEAVPPTPAPSSKDGKGSTLSAKARASAGARGPLARLHPCNAGSGYPGDPACKAWLSSTFDPLFGWPSVVRFSWATAKDKLDASGVAVEWEEEPEGGAGGAAAGGPAQMGLGNFFGAPAGASAAAGKPAVGGGRPMGASGSSGVRSSVPLMARAPFFRKRYLKPVTDL